MTEPEVAAILKVHPRTLRKVRGRGQIRYVRIGRCIRYTAAEVAEFLANATIANELETARKTKSVGRRRGNRDPLIPFTQLAKR